MTSCRLLAPSPMHRLARRRRHRRRVRLPAWFHVRPRGCHPRALELRQALADGILVFALERDHDLVLRVAHDGVGPDVDVLVLGVERPQRVRDPRLLLIHIDLGDEKGLARQVVARHGEFGAAKLGDSRQYVDVVFDDQRPLVVARLVAYQDGALGH